MAFWGCVLALKLMMEAGLVPDADVAYVVESGTEGYGDIAHMFADMSRNDPSATGTRAISLAFESKQRFVPLQAADILAYELYREVPRQLGLTVGMQRRRNLEKLAEPTHAWGYFNDAELDKWARQMSTWPWPNQGERRSRRKSKHGR